MVGYFLLCCRHWRNNLNKPPISFPILGGRWTKIQRGWDIIVSLAILNLVELKDLVPDIAYFYAERDVNLPANQPSWNYGKYVDYGPEESWLILEG